jgi:hypothetical protein
MSNAIAALKVWALAEIVMAAVYFGAWTSLRFEDPTAPPPPSPLIAGLELAYLVPFFAALVLSWRWWKGHRSPPDPRTKWGLLIYSLASIASFALWDNATTLADVRPLYALDAAISLAGLWPALSLIAFIRKTAAQP